MAARLNVAMIRDDLAERLEFTGRFWKIPANMTREEALACWGQFSSKPSSLHIYHFGQYELLRKLLNDYR